MFLSIFPTAYFFHTDYTESLFLALVLATFLAMHRGCWIRAGLFGAAATLTHIHGILLVPALLSEVGWRWYRHARLELCWLLSAGLVVAGLAGYSLYNYHITGDALAFLHLQRGKWGNYVLPPWQGVARNWDIFRHYGSADARMLGVAVFLFLGIAFVSAAAALFYLPLAYAVWSLGALLLFTCQSWDINAPREVLCIFPIYILMARASRYPAPAVLLMVWSVLFLAAFAGQFAVGHWAY